MIWSYIIKFSRDLHHAIKNLYVELYVKEVHLKNRQIENIDLHHVVKEEMNKKNWYSVRKKRKKVVIKKGKEERKSVLEICVLHAPR